MELLLMEMKPEKGAEEWGGEPVQELNLLASAVLKISVAIYILGTLMTMRKGLEKIEKSNETLLTFMTLKKELEKLNEYISLLKR